MEERFLRGSCTCGRNRYSIQIPPDRSTSQTTVFFDNSSATRRIHASPMAAFLRVPLNWLHSATYALYPDEDHNSIRRIYTTAVDPGTRRHFCGYCGTQLSTWSEKRRDDADFICLTLGSLLDEDVDILESMGILPTSRDEDETSAEGDPLDRRTDAEPIPVARQEGGQGAESFHVWTRGTPWFEEMVEHSGLAKVRRRAGGHVSEDGTTSVEYEIVELDHDDSAAASRERVRGKRKYEDEAGQKTQDTPGDGDGDGDFVMSGALRDD